MSVDIDPAWLGDYRAGDAWEGGARRVRLWRDAEHTLRFAYNYESRGNHGYSLASESGTVIDVSATAITVEVTSSSSSAWEDLFKEDFNHQTSTPRRQIIEIERIENGRPVLVYSAKLRWVETR
ncbi:MAG: hypothetical protein H0T46_07820 [Deltaproteobacteria bacterium]|nr:hypothetical protein [Deltaproteobacteria bacterium]